MKEEARAEMVAGGLVQGVGFRYFIQRNAQALGLTGYTKNLYSGEVMAIAEGRKDKVEELFNRMKSGPSHSDVRDAKILWSEFRGEFKSFDIRS